MPENAESVRWAWDAVNAGDAETGLGLLAADVEWQVAEEHPESRVCRGTDEIRDYLVSWRNQVRDTRFDIEELVERDDRVVAIGRFRGVGITSGLDIDVRLALVYSFRDGLVVRVEEYLDPARALEAAGLSG